MATSYTEGNHDTEFVNTMQPGSLSVEQGTAKSGVASMAAGTVLGRVGGGTATQAFAGTGNGVMTLDATTPVLGNAQEGDYIATCITAASGGGTFRVEAPDGTVLGDVAVGTTFADQIKFSIADGSTDFVVGDKFTVTASAVAANYAPVSFVATDGSQFAAGILMSAADPTSADQLITVLARMAEVNGDLLTWPSGATAAQKAAASAQLAVHGVVVR